LIRGSSTADYVKVSESGGWRAVATEKGVAIAFDYDLGSGKLGCATLVAELAVWLKCMIPTTVTRIKMLWR
jgi:hypothetical protein